MASVLAFLTAIPQFAAAQGALTNGGNHAGSISAAGELDEWTFTAAQGDTIALGIGEVFVGEVDPGFVPWIRLFSPADVLLGSNWGPLTGHLTVTAPLTGTYRVVVGSNDGGNDATGHYLLTLAHIPGTVVVPGGDEGGPLTNGGNHPGVIHLGDLDQWTFQAAQNDTIAVGIGEVFVGEVDPGFVPWIRVYSPAGVLLGSNWGPLTGHVTVTAPLTGTYTVLVGTNDGGNDATGHYQLTLAKIPGTVVVPDGDEGGPLSNGGNHQGFIHVGDLDQWTFQAAQNETIAVGIGEVFVSEVDPGFVPWIRVYSPAGVLLGSNWGPLTGHVTVTAPLTGTYTVLVGTNDGGNDAAGHYQLTLAKIPGTFVVPDGDEGGPLSNGGNHPGFIHVGDLDQWTFQAAQNETIAVGIGEVFVGEVDPGFVPWIRLYSPAGVLMGSNWGPLTGHLTLTAPLTGTYTVLVGTNDGGNDAAGHYRLTVAKIPGAFVVSGGDEGGPMTNGFDHPGTIHLGDLDPWTFTAAQGASLSVTITEVLMGEVDPGFVPWIRLYSPAGVLLGSNWGTLSGQINVGSAPLTGIYTVLAGTNDGGNDATGHYLVKVLGATDVTTFMVTPSAGPNGSISPSTPQVVSSGATPSFTITPAPGHGIQSVGGTCGGTLNGQVFTTAAVTANCTVIANFAPSTGGPTMTLDKTVLYYAAVSDGLTFLTQTSAQIVRLIQSGAGAVSWTATSNQPWLVVSPTSGMGSADLSVSVVATGGLPVGGSVAGAITLVLSGAGNAVGPIEVVLTTLAPGTTANPFGTIDTPLDNGTGISGAVPFTGWGLDDIEVEGVMICRAPVHFEAAPADPNCGGAAQIFIGNAVFIDGARPDVAAGFPTYPRSSRAGWGFMVLTNMLPDVARGLPTGGNGTYTFFIYARDREGLVTLMGTRTLTCDNEHATKPFGTIDTPGQGEVVSGASYVNFGWALTPQPKFIPFDGSTITVFVDGVPVGTVSYNHFRPDIAGFFPGLANSGGAVGFRVIDTTALSNGLHTIAWGVSDNEGSVEGLGSRFFTVANGVAAMSAARVPGETEAPAVASAPAVSTEVEAAAQAPRESVAQQVAALPAEGSPIRGRRGFDPDAALREYTVGAMGRATVRGEELDRFELHLGTGGDYTGHLRVGTDLAPLPVGSRLDAATGVFTWAPGVGFAGTYDLVFVRAPGGRPVARREVRIVLAPKGSTRRGPQVVIDTPGAQQDVGQPFMLAGWAADLDAATGPGIATLHVWAYPLTGEAPVFLGVADYGGARPDVGAVHGEPFRDSGYGLVVQGLVPGNYDLAVFAWSTVRGAFVPASVVRVTVR